MGLLLALVVTALVRPVAAQPADIDPPGRVARLAELAGPASFFHPDNGDWAEAVRNLPLTTGDRLATQPGSRAELQIGTTMLRLDGGSDLEVVTLDDTHIAVQLHAGAVAVRVRNAAEAGQVDVLTDDGRFLALRAGSFRVDRGSRSSFVSVDSGEVRYAFLTSALNVGAGQRGEFWVDANGAAQYALLPPVADAFTAWTAERERDAGTSVAARYASPEMTGVEELDRYGTWEQTPDIGAVWTPTAVATDWAPYSTGRWAWVRPWGWTWVDDAPWGFAPFHYGRWVNYRNRWCWTPGTRQPRPVWAPALVAWVGGGPPARGPRGPSGPAVGWFPLAPREVYVPSYASTPRYVRSINRTHVGNPSLITATIDNPRSARDFENRRFPQAVTFAPNAAWTERRPLGPPVAQFRNGPWGRDLGARGGAVVSTTPPVGPPSVPLLGGDARRPPRPPPGFAEDRGGRRERFAERDASSQPGVQPPSSFGDVRGRPGDGRDRDGRDRDGGQGRDRDGDGIPDRAGTLPARTPGAGFGGTGQPGRIGAAGPPPVAPAVRSTDGPEPGGFRGIPQRSLPSAAPAAPQSPSTAGPEQPGGFRGLSPPGAPARGVQPPVQTAPPPREPTMPQLQQQPRPQLQSQPDAAQSPRMRVLPVRRGDDPRIREDAGGVAPMQRPELRPQPPAAPAPPIAAAPPIAPMRPIESSRAPERIAPIQPVQPQLVAPRQIEATSPRLAPQRPAEPPRQSESPRISGPERRNDPGASR